MTRRDIVEIIVGVINVLTFVLPVETAFLTGCAAYLLLFPTILVGELALLVVYHKVLIRQLNLKERGLKMNLYFENSKTLGYYWEKTKEVSINLRNFNGILGCALTLRHEMRHAWQHEHLNIDAQRNWNRLCNYEGYSGSMFYWLNPIEIDARRFQFFLDPIPEDKMNSFRCQFIWEKDPEELKNKIKENTMEYLKSEYFPYYI